MKNRIIKKLRLLVDDFNSIELPVLDKAFTLFMFVIFEIGFCTGGIYLMGLIFNPSSILTLLVMFFVLYWGFSMSLIFNENTSNLNTKTTLIIAFQHILVFILSCYLSYKIMPYRGDDQMKLRKVKLKRLIRKSRWDKLKFWK